MTEQINEKIEKKPIQIKYIDQLFFIDTLQTYKINITSACVIVRYMLKFEIHTK